MSRLPILLLLLSAGIQAQRPNYFAGDVKLDPKVNLQHHMDVFQFVALSKDKDGLKKMMPVIYSDEDSLDLLIIYQGWIKNMQAKEAKYVGTETKDAISGLVEYTHNNESTSLLKVIIERAPESPSGYKFVSLSSADESTKRKFPVCLVGFIWCYLYLIDIFPGTVEQVFNGWST